MSRNKFIIICLSFFLVLGFFMFLQWVSLSQQEVEFYGMNSYAPSGLKAIVLLLEKEGFTITETDIAGEIKERLMIVPVYKRLDNAAKKKILAWVNSGGTVVELALNKPQLIVDASAVYRRIPESREKLCAPSGSVYQIQDLNYRTKSGRIYAKAGLKTGFYAINDNYFIYSEKYGRGIILSWNDPDGLTNIHVKKHPDNAVIFAMLIKIFSSGRTIGFYIPEGPQGRPVYNLSQLFDRYKSAFLLIVLGSGLMLWKLAARFGRPRPLVLAKGRSMEEFVYSMAALFQQAEARMFVLDNLWNELYKTIKEITLSPAENGLESAVKRLGEITGKDYSQIIGLHHEIQSLAHDKRLKGRFADLALKIDNYRKELEGWKKSRILAIE